MPSKVVVLIPAFKNPEKLTKCREAVKDYPVVVHEDALGKGFTNNANYLLKQFVKDTKHEYGILLNQDCYLKEGAIDAMIEFMDNHPSCGVAGIKQLATDNPDKIIHGGTKDCFPTGIHEVGLVSKGDCNISKKVPWVNGAVMIFRKEALIETGLLDPNMAMFGSDSDISYRMRSFNWECWYVSEAECYHDWGVSKTPDVKMNKRFTLDMLAFRDKWIGTELYRDLSQERF